MTIINFGNHQKRSLSTLLILLSGIISLILSACSTPKNITYFRDIPDTIKQRIVDQALYATPVIQTDDILQVTIQTLDPTASALLNQQSIASWPTNGTSSTP